MRRTLAGLGVLLLAASACSEEHGSPGPYAAEIEEAYQRTESDFQREVLADGVVSRAEYEEALNRFVSCIHDNGAHVALVEQAGYYVYRIDGDIGTYEIAESVCSPETKNEVEGIYVDMLMNPDKSDYPEILAACMVQSGVVKVPFTPDDLEDLERRAGLGEAAVSSDGSIEGPAVEHAAEGTQIDPEAERIMGSQEVDNCRANPNYYTPVESGEIRDE